MKLMELNGHYQYNENSNSTLKHRIREKAYYYCVVEGFEVSTNLKKGNWNVEGCIGVYALKNRYTGPYTTEVYINQLWLLRELRGLSL